MAWSIIRGSYRDLKVTKTPWGIRVRIRPGIWVGIDGPTYEKFKRLAGLHERDGGR